MKKDYDKERTKERRASLKDANKEEKRAVAQARAAALQNMYEDLGGGVGMEGEVHPISEAEVREALKKMKNG